MLRRVLTVGLVAAALTVAGIGGAKADQPSIEVSPGVASPGQQVVVTGTGFTKNQLVRLSLCGNGAALGSVDCDQQTSETFPPTDTGAFQIRLPVTVPPKPCPCVVVARASNIDHDITVPITLLGVASGPLELPSAPGIPIKVVDARLSGWGPLTAWFGASPHRTLTLRLQNTSGAPLTLPSVSLTRGRGDNPTTIARTSDLGELQPGETKAWQIPITFDPLSVGSYTVRGSIDGFGQPVTFATRTSAFPWGLLAIALIIGQMLLLRARNRARRRMVPEEIEEVSPAAVLVPDVGTEPDVVPEETPEQIPAAAATALAGSRRPMPQHRRPRPLHYEKAATKKSPTRSKATAASAGPKPQPSVPRRQAKPVTTEAPAAAPTPAAPALLELRDLAKAFSHNGHSEVVDVTDAAVARSDKEAITDELMHAGYGSMDEFPAVDALNYWGSALLSAKAEKRPHLSAVPKAG